VRNPPWQGERTSGCGLSHVAWAWAVQSAKPSASRHASQDDPGPTRLLLIPLPGFRDLSKGSLFEVSFYLKPNGVYDLILGQPTAGNGPLLIDGKFLVYRCKGLALLDLVRLFGFSKLLARERRQKEFSSKELFAPCPLDVRYPGDKCFPRHVSTQDRMDIENMTLNVYSHASLVSTIDIGEQITWDSGWLAPLSMNRRTNTHLNHN
jgi:hypothetical protein